MTTVPPFRRLFSQLNGFFAEGFLPIPLTCSSLQKRVVGFSDTGCYWSNAISKALTESWSADFSQWPGVILSSSTTNHRKATDIINQSHSQASEHHCWHTQTRRKLSSIEDRAQTDRINTPTCAGLHRWRAPRRTPRRASAQLASWQ